MATESESSELFSRNLNEVNRRLYELISSNSANDKMGAILALEKIIQMNGADIIGPSLVRYANYLRAVLPNKDPALMREASYCLGRILAKSGPIVNELVDFEANRVFQWLHEKSESSHLAACFISEILLMNYTALSQSNLSNLFDSLWNLMRDPRSSVVLELASKSLKASLIAIKASYDHNSLVLFSQRTLSSLVEELRSNSSSILCALLILGHSIDVTADTLNLENGSDIFEIVLSLSTHRSSSIRLESLQLVPPLAAQIPKPFAIRYLDRWIAIIVEGLKKEKDKTPYLIAIASSANALNMEISSHLAILTNVIKGLLGSALKSRTEEHWLFSSISSLADACKSEFLPSARLLIPLILKQELTESSVMAIVASIKNAPEALAFVESQIFSSTRSEIVSGKVSRMNLAVKLISSVPFCLPFLCSDLGKLLLDFLDDHKIPAETRLLIAKAIMQQCKRNSKP